MAFQSLLLFPFLCAGEKRRKCFAEMFCSISVQNGCFVVYCITIYGEVGSMTDERHQQFVHFGSFLALLCMSVFVEPIEDAVAAFVRNRLFHMNPVGIVRLRRIQWQK
ncbi:MAG: hypothetical protein Q4C03_06760 [bacterium]|nr:hypothetical protein [bacterium]